PAARPTRSSSTRCSSACSRPEPRAWPALVRAGPPVENPGRRRSRSSGSGYARPMASAEPFSPLRWSNRVLYLLDQLRLPAEEVWVRCRSAQDVHQAIREMIVRGAPAIGCAAAYGVALAARRLAGERPALTPARFRERLD